MINRLLFIALIVSMGVSSAQAEGEKPEITVFSAASLTGAFGEIGEIYENQTGIQAAFNFDGSQALRTQIENGAYTDLFVSANNKQMDALKGKGMMNNSSIIIFTRNKLALIIPKDNPADIDNLTDLARPGVKIVIGTKDVPVGDYALQLIARLGDSSAYGPSIEEQVLANIISQETNVNYVVAKVALGEADAGFAYVSDITTEMAGKVDKIEIPDEYNIIAEYPMGILLESRYPAESQEFIDLVMSEEGQAVLERYGFMPVEKRA